MVINQKITDKYSIYNGDCLEVMGKLPKESIHLSVYSPPFCGLYQYSSSEKDLSNCDSYEDFFIHYEYVIKEIERITKKGRCTAVHCMDTPTGNSGKDGLTDFPGDIIREHIRCRKDDCKASLRDRLNGFCGHGLFDYIVRHAIWKEPLTVRNRTMQKNLAHKTAVDDSIYCGVAGADYLLIFRKKGLNEIPVSHPTGFTYYAGEREMPKELLKYKGYKGNQIKNIYSHWIWRQYASSFWDDIRLDRVLSFKEAREEDDEKHVHPLQLDVIERVIQMRTNKDEIVLTPFAGVFSEPYVAVINNRKGIGIELKESYYKQGVKNMIEAENFKRDENYLF